MICIKSQNFYLNRILLLAIGLWPYQQSTRLVRFQIVLILCILTSFIMFQLTTFVTAKCTLILVIKIFSSIFFFLIHLIEYNSFWFNMQTVKYLLEQLQRICNELSDKNEIAIIRDCGSYAKLFTVGMILIAIGGVIVFSSLPFWNFKFLLHTNMSQSHHTIQIMTEYFVDQEEYLYFILLHLNASWYVATIVLIAIGTTFVGYIIHFCGMFRIASKEIIHSYRIEHAMDSNILKNTKYKNQVMICKEIVRAVDIHRKAMEYSQCLISNFEKMFFSLILLWVLCLSLNFFRIFQIVSFGGDSEEFLLRIFYVFIIFVFMYTATYAGQEITNHNNHIFFTAYNVQWYLAPIHVQKLILFLLQMGNKPFILNISGLFIANLESFAMLMNASISYFTVMYSTQN